MHVLMYLHLIDLYHLYDYLFESILILKMEQIQIEQMG
jgi:hypothetical protein